MIVKNDQQEQLFEEQKLVENERKQMIKTQTEEKQLEEEAVAVEKKFTCDVCNHEYSLDCQVGCSKCSQTCCKDCWHGSCPHCVEDLYSQTMPF